MQRLTRVLALATAATMTMTVLPLAAAEPSQPSPVPSPAPGLPTSTALGDSSSLEKALKRDLGMTYAQFKHAGVKADEATAIEASLARDPGFERVTMNAKTGALTVVGTGAAVARVAKQHGATVSAAGIETKVDNLHQLRAAYLKSVGRRGLVSIAETANGYTIKVTDPQAKGLTMTPAAFARGYRHVTVQKATPAMARAEILTNGQGINLDLPSSPGYVGICSVGFSGFTNTGARTVLTAGHCAEQWGVSVYARDIVSEPAMGGNGWTSAHPRLGSVAWSEFGSPVGYVGTDFATIEGITADYALNPGVLKWQASGTTNAASNQVQVTGVTTATIGAPVCRSGRTTGWWCSTITELGTVSVDDGAGNYYEVDSLVSARLHSDHGDSGGSVLIGNKAVGVLSAGGEIVMADGSSIEFSSAALLKTVTDPQTSVQMRSLESAKPGYQPKLFMQTPTVSSTRWLHGQVVRGVLPPVAGDSIQSGTVVKVVEAGQTVATAPVASNGSFSFTWTGKPGVHNVEIFGSWGYSTSPKRTITVATPNPNFGDQNADGVADLMTIRTDGSLRVTYLDRAQQPTSTVVTATSGWGGYDFVQMVRDVNGDGWEDLLVRRTDNHYLYLRPGQGFGRFGPESLATTMTTRWLPVAVLPDVDGDGQDEFLGRDGQILQRWQVQAGTGKIVGGSISSRQWLVTGQSVSFGDHSGDGSSDLMHVADETRNLLRTQFGPSGAIIGSRSVGAGWYPSWLTAVGDMNGDGRRDMVMLQRNHAMRYYGNVTNSWTGIKDIAGDWSLVKQVF